MSHFTVLVIGEDPETQLEKFDESIEMPRYVRYTKEQLTAKGRKRIEEYQQGTYAQYLADKEKYISECRGHHAHINYLENTFPPMLSWNDDQIYEHEAAFYEPEDIGEQGEIYSTYNPNSKWDWYVLGGRWCCNIIRATDGERGEGYNPDNAPANGYDQAYVEDITNLSEISTFAVVKDGKWYERGEMGWWGCVSNEISEQEWEQQYQTLLQGLSDDTLLSIFDCHI